MTHLPLDPFSLIAIALLCAHIALVWARRSSSRLCVGRLRTGAVFGRFRRSTR